MSISQNVIREGEKTSLDAAPVAVVSAPFSGGSGSGLPAVFECEGAQAPLDLFNGHLTDSFPPSFFSPVSRGLPPQFEPRGWFAPDGRCPAKDSGFHYVAKVQRFESGGYEAMFLRSDLSEVARLMDAPRASGSRVQGEQDENNIASSINRSKRRIRHLIKSMGCDRLLTLTKRESDPNAFWGVQDWAAAWERFNRACKKMGVALVYVAVLERHKKGNYHLHAAIAGRISVKHIRKIWLACCGGGKGAGNVDVSMKQGLTPHKRRAGLARYVSKYVSKQLGHTEFNKKRYWSSRHKLPDTVRYVLSADDAKAALVEFAGLFALDAKALLGSAFFFKSGLCAWFAFDEFLAASPPF